MRAAIHVAGFVGTSVPIFDIRDAKGDGTDLLIRDAELGRNLAECFEGNNLVLMRGHGSTVVAESLPKVVYRAIYAEVNAQCLGQALLLGDVCSLSESECEACASSEAEVQRPWNLWKEQARRQRESLAL